MTSIILLIALLAGAYVEAAENIHNPGSQPSGLEKVSFERKPPRKALLHSSLHLGTKRQIKSRMSEFWKRKMRTYFSRFDYDNDGVIRKSDWIGIALRLAEPVKADKQKAEQLKTDFENVWDKLVKYAKSGNKEQLTPEMFIDSIGKQRYNPELMKRYSAMLKDIFDLMDVNGDGYMQEDEHLNMLGHVGILVAKESFMAKDANGDKKLSYDELVNALWDFLFSEDENNQNTLFFGPLVD